MKTFRYHTVHPWFKGNTHIHSTVSDGCLDFQQLSQLYAGVGYHFLFRTDHWVASDARSDAAPYPLLWLDGTELDGKDDTGANFHIVCLGALKGIDRKLTIVQAVQQARAQGALIILAHPHWTGNSEADSLRHGFDGVEVYNHVCHSLNAKGDAAVYWSAMLKQNPNTLVFAADDAHISPDDPGWNGGWVVVNAPELTPAAVSQALRLGNYYASTGPDFYTIEQRGASVYVKTSPVKFIRMIGPAHRGQKVFSPDGDQMTEAEFAIPESWSSVYLQLEDSNRRMAWTNPLFVVSQE